MKWNHDWSSQYDDQSWFQSEVSCPRTQHNVPGQGSNPDRSLREREATAPLISLNELCHNYTRETGLEKFVTRLCHRQMRKHQKLLNQYEVFIFPWLTDRFPCEPTQSPPSCQWYWWLRLKLAPVPLRERRTNVREISGLKNFFSWHLMPKWGNHILKGQGCSPYLFGVKKAVLVTLRACSPKTVLRGGFCGPFWDSFWVLIDRQIYNTR